MKKSYSLKFPEEKDYLTGKINQFTIILGMVYCCVEKKDYDLFDEPDSIDSYLDFHKKINDSPTTKNMSLKLRGKDYDFLLDNSKPKNRKIVLKDFLGNIRFHLMWRKLLAYGVTELGVIIPCIPFFIPKTLSSENVIPTLFTTIVCSLMFLISGITAKLVYGGKCRNWFFTKWLLISIPTSLKYLESLRNDISEKIFVNDSGDTFYPKYPDDISKPLINDFHKKHVVPSNFLTTLEKEGYLYENGDGTFTITNKSTLWMIISVFIKLQKESSTKLYIELFSSIKDEDCVYRNNHTTGVHKKEHSKIDNFLYEIQELCKKY